VKTAIKFLLWLFLHVVCRASVEHYAVCSRPEKAIVDAVLLITLMTGGVVVIRRRERKPQNAARRRKMLSFLAELLKLISRYVDGNSISTEKSLDDK